MTPGGSNKANTAFGVGDVSFGVGGSKRCQEGMGLSDATKLEPSFDPNICSEAAAEKGQSEVSLNGDRLVGTPNNRAVSAFYKAIGR